MFVYFLFVVCFILAWIFYGGALFFISHLSKKMAPASNRIEEEFTFLQGLWYFSGISLQFGSDKQPKSVSGKTLQAFWSFFTLILVATYTANLAVSGRSGGRGRGHACLGGAVVQMMFDLI